MSSIYMAKIKYHESDLRAKLKKLHTFVSEVQQKGNLELLEKWNL